MRGHEVEIEAIVECENTQMSKRHVQVTLIRDPDGRPPQVFGGDHAGIHERASSVTRMRMITVGACNVPIQANDVDSNTFTLPVRSQLSTSLPQNSLLP
jgi:hypothetical protein